MFLIMTSFSVLASSNMREEEVHAGLGKDSVDAAAYPVVAFIFMRSMPLSKRTAQAVDLRLRFV